MDQNKINYLIISILVLLLVVLGVYYYKNKKVSTQIGQTSITTPTPLPQEPSLETKPSCIPPCQGESASLDKGRSGGVVSELTVAEIKAKFNMTMDNARIAFRNKDYPQAIVYYNQALTYQNTDTPYSGLFVVYGVQGDWVNAQKALDSAIKLNPLFTDYWVSKLTVLDEKTDATYQDLKNIYKEGLLKVDPKTKINLVTIFAGIAEKNNQKAEAITIWEYAKQLYPQNSDIFQEEINRLQKM